MSGGGGGGDTSTTSYTYQAAFAMGLGEGPIQGVGTIWAGKTATTAAALGFSVFTGGYSQAPWGFLQSNHQPISEEHTVPSQAPYTVTVDYPAAPFADAGVVSGVGETFTGEASGTELSAGQYSCDGSGDYTFAEADAGRDLTISYTSGNQQPPSEALSYSGTAYLAAAQYDLGDSTSLPNHNVEANGFFSTSVPGSVDADPGQFVPALLTNPDWGLLPALPSDMVGDLSNYSAYCVATGMLLGTAYTQQQACAQVLSDIATYTNSDVAWIVSSLTLIPRGDQAVTANGVTYTPPGFTFTLGDDDWLPINAATTSAGSANPEPLVLTQQPQDQLSNEIPFEFYSRANAYAPETITARDLAAIQTYGRNIASVQQAHLFAEATAARLSAQLYLQRLWDSDRWQGTIAEHRSRISIGDRGLIGSAAQGIPLFPVIVGEVTEQNDGSRLLVFQSFQSGIGTAAAHTFQSAQAQAVDYNADAGNANVPVIFEPPDALGGGLQVWLGTASPNPLWAGCQMWISDDGETYARAGTITGKCRQGVLSAALPAAVNGAPAIDSADVLAVDLSSSLGVLASGTQADAVNLISLCWCGGELLAYQTATLSGSNAYTLSYLVRGAYGTAPAEHPAGSSFLRVDPTLAKFTFSADQIGRTVYLKLLSFNVWGGGLQSLDEVEPTAYTLLGSALASPLPDVTGIATAYVAGISQLTWSPVTDFRAVDYEIRQGSDPNSAQMVARTPLTQSPTYGDGMYWLAAHYQVPNGPDVYSATWQGIEITGSQLVANVVASWSEAADGWSGTCAGTAILGGRLTLQSAGDEMQSTDVTSQQNVFAYGGYVPSGTYQIPAARRVVLPRVATCTVAITLGAVLAQSDSVNDILSAPDVTAVVNVTGIDLGTVASASPQIRLSQDGVTWGAWQAWIPGAYTAMGFDARVVLATTDPTVAAVLTDFAVAVDVPDLVQSATNVAVPAAGLTVTFAQPFVGGPAGEGQPPLLQVSIIGAESGDTVVISWRSTTGFAVQVVNGGVGVARTVDYTAQGF